MKFNIDKDKIVGAYVTPLAGVWIEITITNAKIADATVTPLAGVWIEIITKEVFVVLCSSHSPCGSVD